MGSYGVLLQTGLSLFKVICQGSGSSVQRNLPVSVQGNLPSIR